MSKLRVQRPIPELLYVESQPVGQRGAPRPPQALPGLPFGDAAGKAVQNIQDPADTIIQTFSLGSRLCLFL